MTLRKNTKTTSFSLSASAACLLASPVFLVSAWQCRLSTASDVLSLPMQLQFYIFDLHYASVFQQILSPTGAPELGFPINDYREVQATVKLLIVSFFTVYYVFVKNSWVFDLCFFSC